LPTLALRESCKAASGPANTHAAPAGASDLRHREKKTFGGRQPYTGHIRVWMRLHWPAARAGIQPMLSAVSITDATLSRTVSRMLDDQEIRNLLLRSASRDEGSAEAFERLYRRSAPTLLGIAQRIVGRREVAEEVLHDAYAAIWRNAGTFDPLAAQPVAWMAAIVRNRAIDVRSSHDVSRVDSYHDTLDDDPDGALDRLFDWSPALEDGEDLRRASAWLRNCLAGLQAAERQALVLAYEHGLSHGELAAHLRKPLGTVKSWVRRGMDNLRRCMETCMGGGR
jgi:RNA polymerase sigma-70 factor (ECF subfamily)